MCHVATAVTLTHYDCSCDVATRRHFLVVTARDEDYFEGCSTAYYAVTLNSLTNPRLVNVYDWTDSLALGCFEVIFVAAVVVREENGRIDGLLQHCYPPHFYLHCYDDTDSSIQAVQTQGRVQA